MPNSFTAALRRLWEKLQNYRARTVLGKLRQLFGPDALQMQTHDKYYPGYDLASINLALNSYLEDCCAGHELVGTNGFPSMRQLFNTLTAAPQLKPVAPTYQRVPVDVDEEASFVANGLYFCTLRPPTAGAAAEKLAVLLVRINAQVVLSIACRSKEVADGFFREIEVRRQRLSVYRGKVIDPAVGPGGIHTIGFRALKRVSEADLILPAAVRELLHGSVLRFYEHRDALRELGVELKRGILFHGPPGTGKTSVSLYLAGRLPQFTVCFVSGERLLYPRELCRMARYLQPAMLVLEDIDLVAHERHANGLATVLGELMNQIDGCEPTDQVLFVMNTNSLERLEHAVKDRPGRVDQIIELPLPAREDRARLLGTFLRTVQGPGRLDRVVEATEGATPAMLKEIVKRAVVSALSHNGDHKVGKLALSETDLILAAEQVRASREPEVMPGTLGFRERSPR
jgi:hypothetical protein